MSKKKQAKTTFFRVAAGTLAAFALLFLLFCAAGAVFAAWYIDKEADEALFTNAGNSTLTRFYYHDSQSGTALSQIPGYMAVEWQKEGLCSSARSLYTHITDMPQYLPAAFVAIEDHRFYQHDGVDVLRTGKAIVNHLLHFSGRFGGSSITQQLIKNIGGEKDISIKRKCKEMIRAISLEKRHSKEEILEAYLNIVPLSRNCVGVGAASLAYFGKPPSDLSLAEAASLAAITRSPTAFDPTLHPAAHTKRRNVVLARMRSLSLISEEECQTALSTPLVLSPAPWQAENVCSWYTETVIQDVIDGLIQKGYTRPVAEALVARGGLRIYTCMDIKVQQTLERHFESTKLLSSMGKDLSAAMTVLDPATGDLLGIVGNIGIKKADRPLNHATDTLRAPGSVLKPVALYAPAIDRGLINEATVFDDVPKTFSGASLWPHNAPARYDGLVNVKTALTHSKNTVAVDLYQKLGAEEIYHTLHHRLGIQSLCRQATGKDGRRMTDLAPAPLALGQLTYGVNLRQMTAAYLPLLDGVMHKSRSFLLVLDRDGNILLDCPEQKEQVFQKTTASVMTHMLSSVVEDGTAKGLLLSRKVDTAGKTGTSGQNRDRWFIGYTPYYLAGIWCGYENADRPVNGTPHLRLWDEVMCELHRDILQNTQDIKSFGMAKGLRACRVCRDSGLLCSEACSHDPRGERGVTVWLREEEIPHLACRRHTLVFYDPLSGGVVPEEEKDGHPFLTQVALLDIPWRDFPRQVIISDAEYVYRPFQGKISSPLDNEAYFAAKLPPGHFAGISARTTRQFNAYAPPTLSLTPSPQPLLRPKFPFFSTAG